MSKRNVSKLKNYVENELIKKKFAENKWARKILKELLSIATVKFKSRSLRYTIVYCH